MGNIIDILLFWRGVAPTPTPVSSPTLPRKVSINCACFNSKVVDDTDSSNSNEGQEEEFHSLS